MGVGRTNAKGAAAGAGTSAGDTVTQILQSGTTYTPSTSYIKMREIQCLVAGTYRVLFAMQDGSDSGIAYGRIYKNGVAIGTERSVAGAPGYTTFTEDLTFAANDLIQLYQKASSGAYSHVSSMTIKSASLFTITLP